MADLRLGELVACGCCGAQARATWSSRERPWQEGWPVTVTWTHGPHPRTHVVTGEAPSLCSWCFDRRQALGPDAQPLYLPVEVLPAEAADDAAEWCTDLGDPVPAWVTECTGHTTAAGLVEKYGLHARIARPLAAPPEPRHLTYLDDRLDGSVSEPAPAPTQLGLF